MLTELRGKGGALCRLVKEGKIRCPLNVRPTSEDVITGNLFGTLGVLNPRWWLPDLLNEALGHTRFDRQVFRRFQVQLWEPRPRYPRELIPWDEGRTEVDVKLTWENPPTTVYIEMKYSSKPSATTTGNDGSHGFPADQMVRNARVGLWECGWFKQNTLFEIPRRDFVLLLCSPAKGHELIQTYREPQKLLSAIPHGEEMLDLPALPFIGELSYEDILQLLRRQKVRFTHPEQRMIDLLVDYLDFKLNTLSDSPYARQITMPFDDCPTAGRLA